jgi:hypothetical protein
MAPERPIVRDLRARQRTPALLRTPVLAAGLVALLVAGCATCARNQRVEVRSTPSAAQVFVDGDLVGETPAQLTLRREHDHSVFIKKPGHVPELVVVESQLSDEGVRFLVPWEIHVRLAPADARDRDLEVETED